jgi:hypothetical protein
MRECCREVGREKKVKSRGCMPFWGVSVLVKERERTKEGPYQLE